MLDLTVEQGLALTEGKSVAIGEHADIPGCEPRRVDWVADRSPRRRNGNPFLPERIRDWHPARRRLDGCGELRIGSGDRFPGGQGDGRRAGRRLGRRGFGVVMLRLLVAVLRGGCLVLRVV